MARNASICCTPNTKQPFAIFAKSDMQSTCKGFCSRCITCHTPLVMSFIWLHKDILSYSVVTQTTQWNSNFVCHKTAIKFTLSHIFHHKGNFHPRCTSNSSFAQHLMLLQSEQLLSSASCCVTWMFVTYPLFKLKVCKESLNFPLHQILTQI